jgi:hypothetical protein
MVLGAVCGMRVPAARERAASSAPFGSAANRRIVGLMPRRGDADAGHQAAAADWGDECIKIGHFGEQLQRGGALAGHDIGMIVWRDEHGTGFLLDAGGRALAGGEVRGTRHDVAAVALDGAALDGRGAGGHDDVGADATQVGDQGERLRVIAGAVRHNATGGIGVGRDFGMTSEPTKAIKSLALGRPCHITYGGVQDMQHVDDVARTIVCCLERPYQGAKS